MPCSTLADVDEDRFPSPWLIVVGTVAALALIFILGVGFGQQWGAPQWGPLSAWIAGVGTFGAVFLALREAARGQREREIDHEISRRRECITALGDLWGAVIGMGGPGGPVEIFINYLDGLDPEFNPKEQRIPEIVRRIQEFWGGWTSTVEPPLFTARLVLRGTPLYGPAGQLSEEISNFTGELRGAIEQVLEGQRPDAEPLITMWHDLQHRDAEHATLAEQHFSLDRRDVERYLRQSRRR